MNGQELLGSVAFYVSIAVIIGIAIMFSVLFCIYGFYKIKHIKYGHEDEKIEKTLRSRYKEIIKRRADQDLKISDVEHFEKVDEPDYVMIQNLENVKTFTLVGTKETDVPKEPTSVLEAILEEKKKSKKWTIVSNVFFGIFYALLLILLGIAIAFRVTNQTLYIGNTTLVAIHTGSMETVNEDNGYIFENGLEGQENRIVQYSLISLNKVDSPDDLKLYNIYGYLNNDGVLIVHRLIRINTNQVTGEVTYTFKGDANSSPLSYEMFVNFDQIVGEYSGFQNYGLGVAVIYMQSSIGMIAILAALCFLLSYQIAESRIDKAYDKRTQEIAKEIDAKKVILDIRSKKMKKVVEKI